MAKMLPQPLLLLLLLAVIAVCSSTDVRVELRYIEYSKGNFSKMELLQRAAERSRLRMASLQAMQTDVETRVYASTCSFLMELAVGTPPLSYSAMVDTGSDLIWTQCKPCIQCFPQPTPLYDPSQSLTYATLPCTSPQCQALPRFSCSPNCRYNYSYADSSYSDGVLGTETFTFGVSAPVEVPNIAFGCGTTNAGGADNSAGMVGMGRGPLSLVSQLGDGRFSYCLTSFGDSKTSPLLLGSLASLSSQALSTPFVINPSPNGSFYYLSLQGITVGATLLPISNTTFAIKANGTGGMIIDSGTTITMLVDPAYTALKQAFLSQTNLPVADGSAYGFDLCFSFTQGTAALRVPRLIFHFDGADMNLPMENYVVDSSGLICLVMLRSFLHLSVLGNFQQQNMHILYDLAGGALSFEPAQCDQL